LISNNKSDGLGLAESNPLVTLVEVGIVYLDETISKDESIAQLFR